jgi:hypothetical protein
MTIFFVDTSKSVARTSSMMPLKTDSNSTALIGGPSGISTPAR